MKLSRIGEFGLIETIKRSVPLTAQSVLVGIGDDAAVLKADRTRAMLVTTDMLLEHVHFDLSYTDFYSLGWKAAAVNLSDIAAMGGSAKCGLVSLGIPESVDSGAVQKFYRGLNNAFRKFAVSLVGGDTNRSQNGFVVNVVIIGETEQKNVILRSGAKPGDRIYVTGTLGDSAAGLILLQSGRQPADAIERRLARKHLRPDPRMGWGRQLALSGCVSAMIDVSDGLSSDLGHICDLSKVGAILHEKNIPLSKDLKLAARAAGVSALDLALTGGEDYELLFAVPKNAVGKFSRQRIPATEIGEITASRPIELIGADNGIRLLKPVGFDHFARSQRGAAQEKQGSKRKQHER
jgi:thiamine-monophosphate kinase